ncbi:hypothetical protein [Anaerospora sp.]|uniref:hypothetical protein n=1 Tax=Anaerospora sp. TaxID=1960278 RepID=UPI0028992491|nr:hypothetical protein [Anaerospora sp.]MDF2930049.1 hypothetical protein [Anaerospora sp.]
MVYRWAYCDICYLPCGQGFGGALRGFGHGFGNGFGGGFGQNNHFMNDIHELAHAMRG